MSSRKNVSASTVRAWGRDNLDVSAFPCLGAAARGRLHPEVVKAFNKANRGKTYTPKVAEAPTVTVPVPSKDSKGRNITRKVTMTTKAAREALGQVGEDGKSQRGRLSQSALIAALAER